MSHLDITRLLFRVTDQLQIHQQCLQVTHSGKGVTFLQKEVCFSMLTFKDVDSCDNLPFQPPTLTHQQCRLKGLPATPSPGLLYSYLCPSCSTQQVLPSHRHCPNIITAISYTFQLAGTRSPLNLKPMRLFSPTEPTIISQ